MIYSKVVYISLNNILDYKDVEIQWADAQRCGYNAASESMKIIKPY